MRTDTLTFAEINQSPTRTPRYVVKIDFEGTPSTEYYITSHWDCALPSTVTSDDASVGTLQNLSGTSQRLNPIRAISTIGSMSFNVVDFNGTVTAKINEEYGDEPVTVANKGLKGKTVEFYIGEEGLAWDDYILIQTQIIREVTLKDGTYKFACSDIQRTARKTLFDPQITNLLYNITSTQTGIPVVSVEGYQSMRHGNGYTDLPNEYNGVGYIEIKDEIIAWRDTLSAAIPENGTDVSFSGSVLSSTSIDLSQYLAGMLITITDSTSNDGDYHVASSTANTLTVEESFTTEGTGPDVSILAEIQFYNCSRGRLNTKAVSLTMSDPLPTQLDKRQKVTEIVYLEEPLPKLIYAILTGSVYGKAATLPDNWHLDIDPSFVATSEFTTIGKDLWDVDDDSAGDAIVRFLGPKKVSGKKFIEEELLLLGGLFMPILSDGQFGLRRMTNVLSDASASYLLDETNVMAISPLRHVMDDVFNRFAIEWNYNRKEKRFTRSAQFIDGDSITRHGLSDPLVMKFQGLHGSSATGKTLINKTDGARDRYAGPPQEISVTCLFPCNVIEVGDVVKLRLSNLNDFVEGGSIDRSFEVQQVKTDWRKGTVTLKLFGSSQKAAQSVADLASASELDNSFYSSAGTDISTVSTVTGFDDAGTYRITADSHIIGAATMDGVAYSTGTISATVGDHSITGSGTAWLDKNISHIKEGGITYTVLSVNSDTSITLSEPFEGTTGSGKSYTTFDAIYYYDGNLQIDSGVDLIVRGNVQFRISGDITVNGTIDGIAGGMPPKIARTSVTLTDYENSGVAGGIGTTQAPGALKFVKDNNFYSYPMAVTEGAMGSMRAHSIINTGTDLLGLPEDLRGTSGGQGGYYHHTGASVLGPYPGGRGGYGGSGMIFITKNLFMGASGYVQSTGHDGYTNWQWWQYQPSADAEWRGGGNSAGGGGSPGGIFILIDGDGTAETTYVYNKPGMNFVPFERLPAPYSQNDSGKYNSHYLGQGWIVEGAGQTVTRPNWPSFHRVQHILPPETAVIDVPDETTVASAITLAEVTPANAALNYTAIEIQVSAPVGSGPFIDNYLGSHVFARNLTNTDETWLDIGYVGAAGELPYQVLADGSTWEIKAHAVARVTGVESEDYVSNTIKVSSDLETVIGLGNKVITNTSPELNGGMEVSEAGLIAYDPVGAVKVTVSSTTGIITAEDVDIAGTITATAGDIGGWSITSGSLEAGTAATHIELSPTTGIWMGADTLANAPFSVTNAGVLTAESGTIAGWTIDADSIESSDNRVILDATNNRIQVQNIGGTNYTRLDADGITGVDSVLGTTFRLPTDGTAPSFSSGTINETIFEISTNAILRTGTGVDGSGTTDAGVLINDTGVFGYEANNATPNFELDVADGTITALGATINGTVTSGSTVTGELHVEGSSTVDGDFTVGTSGHIKGGQTAYDTGTGFFLGYETSSYKFSVGDATDTLRWDTTDGLVLSTGSTTDGLEINDPSSPNEMVGYGSYETTTASYGRNCSFGVRTIDTDVTCVFGGLNMVSESSPTTNERTSNLTGVYGRSGAGRGVQGAVYGDGIGGAFFAQDATAGRAFYARNTDSGNTGTCGAFYNDGGGVGLRIDQVKTTGTSQALYVHQKGEGTAAFFRNDAGTSNHIMALDQYSSGSYMCSQNRILHASNNTAAVYASTIGTSAAFYGIINNSANNSAVVYGNTNGNRGGHFVSSKATGTNYGCIAAGASGYDFYANGAGTNYGPFTGGHDGVVKNNFTGVQGDIIVDSAKITSHNISNTIFENDISTSANQKAVVGVVVSIEDLVEDDVGAGSTIKVKGQDLSKKKVKKIKDVRVKEGDDFEEMETDESVAQPTINRPAALVDMDDAEYATLITTHKRISFNAVGEGQINVCGENGDLEAGDLIVASNTAGKGMKQADDIVRGYTVAKVREDVTFSSASEVKMVACIYLCG